LVHSKPDQWKELLASKRVGGVNQAFTAVLRVVTVEQPLCCAESAARSHQQSTGR